MEKGNICTQYTQIQSNTQYNYMNMWSFKNVFPCVRQANITALGRFSLSIHVCIRFRILHFVAYFEMNF